MKKILGNLGKIFIVLKKVDEYDIKQTVLLVDGSFILPNNFALIIKGVKEKFKNANISVLTFRDKENFIRDNLQDVEVITPGNGLIKKYQLAVKLFLLLRRNYAYVILSSLDVSLLLVTMLFSKQPVFLYNRWFEWYGVRFKTILDILLRAKSADLNRRKKNRSVQEAIKSFGRAFIILSKLYEEDISTPMLVVDAGGEPGYITTAVRMSKLNFINPDISVITFPYRKHFFMEMVPESKIFTARDYETRYGLALQMYRMRKARFSYTVLTNLDISPILMSFLFIRGKVFLYNRWHEWWSLSFRTLYAYMQAIPRLLCGVILLIYLLITSGFILLRTALRPLFFGRAYGREAANE